MFSPETNALNGISTRNPRRRQRTGSDDSIALRHNPKRLRRSILSAETFKPPLAKTVNGYVNHVDSAIASNGHAIETRSQRDISVDTASLAIRHKGTKKIERDRRGSKTDGSIELTKNDNYIVTQLPTTPERLRNYQSSEKWHGDIVTSIGYAVAMTHDQALVWRYTQGNNPNESSKPLLIKLPYPSHNPRSPLPFGIVIPTALEPAFLVVMPTDGNITYWESLSSAASIDLNRQKQQGTQGNVSGMMSGEVIVKVTEGEPHGFILTFSTGRVAHMTVSDPQGKPSIEVHYLRSSAAYSGGVFGSLRSVFSSAGWRRDVAAVKAGNSWQRGQRNAVVATTQGAFQVWDLNWNGTHSLVYEIDAKEDTLRSLLIGGHISKDQDDYLFEVLDFAFLPGRNSGKELPRSIEKGDCKLLALVVLKRTDFSRYVLVSLNLVSGSFNIDVIHPINCYTTPIQAESEFRPKVLIPEPAQTAFVIFEKSVVLVSLAEIEDSPSSQLQMEAHTLPDPFQDAIDFRQTKNYRVVGCATEPLDGAQTCSSCVLMIYGFGIIRISALPMKKGQSVFDRATVTAKTKIEQAVFYGSLQQNLLDFSGRPEISFAQGEVEEAALEVSESIMKSTSAYIPVISPSMDQQLQRRSTALADLIKHLAKHYKPLSRLTRWRLMWNAEKMAASKEVWRSYNSTISSKRENDKHLLAEIVEMLHQDYKVENDPGNYETDAVRHWFIHDTWRLEYIIPWAQHAVEMLFKESLEDNERQDSFTQARLLSEANDIQLSALETAFSFREMNASLYGLDDEEMMDGVLTKGFEDLPEIWTSKQNIVEKVKLLVDLSREMAITYDDAEDETAKVVEKLIMDNPRQVQICCQTYIERFRWLKSRDDPQLVAMGKELQRNHFVVRNILFTKLSEICLGQEGIKLAEKYHDMGALADIVHNAMTETSERIERPGIRDSEKDQGHQILYLLKEQIDSYFDKFGHFWATAYFTKHIDRGHSIEVLKETHKYKEPLTHFLRTNPRFAKLRWINEVHSESNYAAAADSLRLVQQEEPNLWSRKIELSMGKLASLAAQSKTQAGKEDVNDTIRTIDQGIAMVEAQEKLFDYIRPTFRRAIDVTAATELATKHYCKGYVEGKPALRDALVRNISKVVARQVLEPEDLIDTLTLMDEYGSHPDENGSYPDENGPFPDEDDYADNRFFTALRLLEMAFFKDGEHARKALQEKIIWRRCINQDDWQAINRTELKDDVQVEVETGATALFKTLREGYRTDFFTATPPPSPSSLLSAGSTLISLRSSTRYAEVPDNALVMLAKDLESEDNLLREHVEKGRLEIWWKGVIDAAKKSAMDERDRDGEETKRRKSFERAFWSALVNELPPPPYTPQAISPGVPPRSPIATGQTESPVAAAFSDNTSIRGGYLRHSPSASNGSTFTSAVTYFDERPCAIRTPSDVLEVNLLFPSGVSRESIEFPKPVDKYQIRDVSDEDWCTFVNYLLPTHPKSQDERKKPHPDEKSEVFITKENINDRRERIKSVTSEWNEGFFGPRGIRIHSEVLSNEAPAYRSITDLSTTGGISIPLRPSRTAAPRPLTSASKDHWQRQNVQSGPFSRRRSSSASSSSSSSSFSSDSSVDSISSRDLEGTNLPQVRATLASIRTDSNLKSDLKTAVRQFLTDLKAQRRALPRSERKQHSRGLKAELHVQKNEIKKEIRSIIKEHKSFRKSERKSYKAERKCRRAERHALRREFRAAKKNHRHPGPFFPPTFAAQSEANAQEIVARNKARELELAARNNARELELAAREQALEQRMVARESELRAKELALGVMDRVKKEMRV